MSRAMDIILRLGLAFAFLYPPIAALMDPYSWMGYLPQFVRGYAPDLVVLHVFGLLEIVIGIWILSGNKIFLPSLAALGVLIAIVLLNLQDFQIIFRDLSIAAIALALAIENFPGEGKGTYTDAHLTK